jgi:membrane-associated protein
MVWVIVLAFVFAECAFIIGLFLPGDSLLFTAGVVLASGSHFVHAWTLSIAAVLAAVAGNMLGFWIGRRSGSLLIARKGGRMLTTEHLQRAEQFLNRHGWWAIVLARWIPWIRTLAPLIAGAAGMRARRYLVATSIGAVLWVPALVLAGYYGAGLFHRFAWVQRALTIACIVCFVAGTAYGLWRYRQEMRKPKEEPENRVVAADDSGRA